jgi:hypothetical protein
MKSVHDGVRNKFGSVGRNDADGVAYARGNLTADREGLAPRRRAAGRGCNAGAGLQSFLKMQLVQRDNPIQAYMDSASAQGCLSTYSVTTKRAPIFQSTRIAQTHARPYHPGSEESSPTRKSVPCITATNVPPPDASDLLLAKNVVCSRNADVQGISCRRFRSRTRLGHRRFHSRPRFSC